jgi:thiamine pyrophosphate-dependent acetolactate synthase large subunit-like protein
MLGMHGTVEANNAMQNCDVLLAVGARLGLWLWLSGPWGAWQAALAVALVVMPLAMVATLGLRESYALDMDYNED